MDAVVLPGCRRPRLSYISLAGSPLLTLAEISLKITGHKTLFMIGYYNIMGLGDVQETGVKMGDWMAKARAEAAAKPRPVPPQPAPSKKQRVRDLHAEGRSVQDIAEQLGISVPTVYYHLSDEAQAATLKRNREHKREYRKLERIEA